MGYCILGSMLELWNCLGRAQDWSVRDPRVCRFIEMFVDVLHLIRTRTSTMSLLVIVGGFSLPKSRRCLKNSRHNLAVTGWRQIGLPIVAFAQSRTVFRRLLEDERLLTWEWCRSSLPGLP